MITAQNLTKKYKKKLAVSDLSFTVNTGRVTGFLGPNGAGKSTTMRLMLGLDRGTGQTLFDDKPLNAHHSPAKLAGILLEAKAFHPTRTARNHLSVLAEAGRIPLSRVDEVLDIVGLKDVARKGPGKFSLGMSQRLGIAAALLGEPRYLILDEPANGLDPEGIAWLRQFIKDYANKGNAVFISSHLLSEMSQMADDIIVIGKGKLIAQGSVDSIIAGSAHAGVFVRSDDTTKLHQTLGKAQANYVDFENGVKVTGMSTEEIGKILFSAGLPVFELSMQNASLEEAFLELTAASEEFSTKGAK
jgi:ABC-2 type transport system ATP-binding protein